MPVVTSDRIVALCDHACHANASRAIRGAKPGRAIAALVVALCFTRADAEPPKQTAAFGIALDATPQVVAPLLAARYQSCRVARSFYRVRPGTTDKQIAALAINPGLASHDPGTLSLCTHSPAGDGVTDAIDARFAHPEVGRNQPLYSLEVMRVYPDAVYAQPPRFRMSFDELRRELLRTYGKPTDERRERIASYAANQMKSLGIDKNVKREDYVVRYLWAKAGRLTDAGYEDNPCECTGRYVKAVIEISRSPSTTPRNTFYALSVKLLVEDPDLRGLQDAWNARQQQPK